MPKCPYCGNTSGKRDSFGGCISCGGQLQELPFAQIDDEHPYTGSSGSSLRFHNPTVQTYFGYPLGIYSVNEIRDMLELPRFEGTPQEQIISATMEEPSSKWIRFQ